VRERTATTWYESGCYPGEPVFVAAPEAQAEVPHHIPFGLHGQYFEAAGGTDQRRHLHRE